VGKSNIAYQYRLEPNKTQSGLLRRLLEIACRLYNDALKERKDAWEKEQRTVTYHEQALKLKDLRATDKELLLLNFSACQHILRRLDKAFQRFFNGLKKGEKVGYPRFKKSHRFRTLEYTYGDGTKIKVDERGRLRLYVQNVGLIKVIWHRPLPEGAVIKHVWITCKADGWFVTFALEVPEEALMKPLPKTGKAVGIDVGLENLLALSDGTLLENPRWIKATEKKIAHKQQILSRKVKGSKRWKRLCKQIAKLHLKVARQRKDYYFKLANWFVKEFDLIVAEDLNIKGLAQGVCSKSVYDASWGVFLNQILPYKAWSAGKVVVMVPPNGTSQHCAVCGHHVPKQLSERQHRCPNCGFEAHRDINSAILILKLGLERARRDVGFMPTSCLQEAVGFIRR
jgi:putative transposase